MAMFGNRDQEDLYLTLKFLVQDFGLNQVLRWICEIIPWLLEN